MQIWEKVLPENVRFMKNLINWVCEIPKEFYKRWVMQFDVAMTPLGVLMISVVMFLLLNLIFAQSLVYTFSYEMCMNTYNKVPVLGGVLKNFCIPMGGVA